MLTDAEIMDIRNRAKLNDNRQIDPMAFARQIERAVMEKAMPIPKQEPVGYVVTGQGISFYRTTKEEAEYQANTLEWRDDKEPVIHPVYIHPRPAQAAAIPEKVTVSQVPHSQYAQGWNDCVDASLSASPKPE